MPPRRVGAIIDRPGIDQRAALVAAGCTELRIPARWADLQPREGQWDGEALEALRTEVGTAHDSGLAPWLALLGRRVPGWFDDEGGFTDPKNAARWWPRFVDGLATQLGDTVAGWFPMIDPAGFATVAFAGRDPDVAYTGYRTLLVAWRDAWRILRGGPPVAAALPTRPWDDLWPRALRTGEPTEGALEVDDLGGSCDLLGAIVVAEPGSSAEEPAELLVRFASEGPERPLVVLVSLRGESDDDRAAAAAAVVTAIGSAAYDGITIDAVFTDSLLGTDGTPSPAAELFATLR